MREKYNAIYENTINSETSYVRKYLGAEIATLLNPESNSIHDIDFDSIYVNLPNVESRLAPLTIHMDSDRCVFLTGLTGCGKSSVLTHMFHVDINKKVHIDNHSLYVLFSFDHAMAIRNKDEITTYFINTIKSVSEEIGKLLAEQHIETSDEGLFQYIKEVRGDNLQYSDGSKSERLKEFAEKDKIEYYTLQLKYYLSALNTIDHVILIVDDIESVGSQMELLPIDLGLTLWSCFKRQPKQKHKVWSSGVVISCRHYVYRMILKHCVDAQYTVKSGVDSQTLESYPIDDEINIFTTAKLVDIIRKRVTALSSVRTGKRWGDAWAVVEHILVKTDDVFGDFIAKICISNIRKSLSILQRVVLNKRWIQRTWKEHTPGAFSIDDIRQFNLNPPCLLRAIALDEGNVYTEDSVIPNILFNFEEAASDLISIITLKAFFKRTNETAINWRISLDRDLITQNVKCILPEASHFYVDRAVEFLIERRLLLRSKNQAQDDGLDINSENIKSIKKVYVSSGAFALWNQLGRSSVMLELYIDDIFLESSNEFNERQSFLTFDRDTFERCIDFVAKMARLEGNIRMNAHNRGLSTQVSDVIGRDFITGHLLMGLISSRNAYYKDDDTYKSDLDAIEEYIKTTQEQLK